MQGAVVVVESQKKDNPADSRSKCFQSGIPLSCIEVLGYTVIDRLLYNLRRLGLDSISVLADESVGDARAEVEQAAHRSVDFVKDVWSGAVQWLRRQAEEGVNTLLIVPASVYTEMEFADFLQFHQEQRRGLTRAVNRGNRFDIWAIDATRLRSEQDPLQLLKIGDERRDQYAEYFCPGYANRVERPADLRRLVTDTFNGMCRLRPQGVEVRGGVWMSDGADVHRGARIVSPAYIGRGSRIEEQCLVTRASNIESNCHVDYGTAIEDSSVLPNSYIGIGLDVAHAVVSGNCLSHLRHDVTLEISDPGVMRRNKILRKETIRAAAEVAAMGAV